MRFIRFEIALTTMVLAAGVVASTQQRAPRNLQVLPKDLTLQQIQPMMKTFAASLGVECSHCHVSSQDRASDAKPTKATARKMIQMVAMINDELLKGVGEPPAAGTAKVTCFTCHRGSLKPLAVPGGGGTAGHDR